MAAPQLPPKPRRARAYTNAASKQPQQQQSSRPLRRRRRARRRNRNRGPKGTRGGGFQLSQCAVDYAACVADPQDGPLACFPNFPACLTRRSRIFGRGTFLTGTSNVGYVLVDPFLSAANNTAGVIWTDGTYAGNGLQDQTLAPVGLNNASLNSDYPFASFGDTTGLAQYRVVSYMIKARCVNSELTKGGQVFALHEPQHKTLVGAGGIVGQTAAGLGSYKETKQFEPSTDNRWVTVRYQPVDLFDQQLVGTFPGVGQQYFMAILAIAPPATNLTFAWEAWGVYEYAGRNVQGAIMSHSDPVGFNAVHGALAGAGVPPVQTDSLAQHQQILVKAATAYGQGATSGFGAFVKSALPYVKDAIDVGSMIATLF